MFRIVSGHKIPVLSIHCIMTLSLLYKCICFLPPKKWILCQWSSIDTCQSQEICSMGLFGGGRAVGDTAMTLFQQDFEGILNSDFPSSFFHSYFNWFITFFHLLGARHTEMISGFLLQCFPVCTSELGPLLARVTLRELLHLYRSHVILCLISWNKWGTICIVLIKMLGTCNII